MIMNKLTVIIFLFYSFSVIPFLHAEKQESKSKFKPKQKQTKTAKVEKEKDFMPSLSDSLNDTNRLKNKIKRELAKELTTNSNSETKKALTGNADQTMANETALFGDLEVTISEREEEDLVEVKKQDKKN